MSTDDDPRNGDEPAEHGLGRRVAHAAPESLDELEQPLSASVSRAFGAGAVFFGLAGVAFILLAFVRRCTVDRGRDGEIVSLGPVTLTAFGLVGIIAVVIIAVLMRWGTAAGRRAYETSGSEQMGTVVLAVTAVGALGAVGGFLLDSLGTLAEWPQDSRFIFETGPALWLITVLLGVPAVWAWRRPAARAHRASLAAGADSPHHPADPSRDSTDSE